MPGSLTIATSAIARTGPPTAPGSQNSGSGRRSPAQTGNPVSPGGQVLPVRPAARPIPQIDFSQIVRQLDAFVENGQRSLRFRADAVTGRVVMTVVNPNTQEVIRQVPAEELLALARTLDGLQGQLLNAES